MGVTLKYPSTGSATLTVDLPYPAHSQSVEIEPNQKEYRSAAGLLFTAKVGPTIYRVGRTFEALSEQEVADLFAFLEGINFAASKIRYCYTDVETGEAVSVVCRVIESPSEQVVHIRNRDVTLKFEQYTHHDAATESSLEGLFGFIDGERFLLIDGTPLLLGV